MAAPLTVVSPYGPTSATTRARALEWVQYLGLDAELHDYVGAGTNRPGDVVRRPLDVVRAERGLRRLRGAGVDRLLLLREATPFDRGGVAAGLLAAARYGVYDLDDALYADRRHWPDPAALFPKPEVARRAAAVADVVVAGNDLIADWACGVARAVVMVPTCVNPDDYPARSAFEWHDPPRLCWLGSPSQERQLAAVAPALLDVHRKTGARLTVISAGNRDLGALSPMVDRVAWTSAFAASLLDADVGIAPLTDDPFSRGKCAYKLLQYAAASLPAVGSPVGANAAALRRTDGVAAIGVDEWREALLEALAEPADRRAGRGAAALAGVTEHYSFGAWAAVWRSAVVGG